MKLINSTIKLACSCFIAVTFSCSNQTSVSELSIDNSTLQLGTEQSGVFTLKTNKTFSINDKIILKFKTRGLTIKQGKIKVNADIFLKKDKDILATESDILGKDGLEQSLTGVDSNYFGNNGEADIKLNIIPPTDVTGEMTGNITVKDLNSSGKLVSFETKFTITGPDNGSFQIGK